MEFSSLFVEVISVILLFCFEVIDGSREELLFELLFLLIFKIVFNFLLLRFFIFILLFFISGGFDILWVCSELFELFFGILLSFVVWFFGVFILKFNFWEDLLFCVEVFREMFDLLRWVDSVVVFFSWIDIMLFWVERLLFELNLFKDCFRLVNCRSFL